MICTALDIKATIQIGKLNQHLKDNQSQIHLGKLSSINLNSRTTRISTLEEENSTTITVQEAMEQVGAYHINNL